MGKLQHRQVTASPGHRRQSLETLLPQPQHLGAAPASCRASPSVNTRRSLTPLCTRELTPGSSFTRGKPPAPPFPLCPEESGLHQAALLHPFQTVLGSRGKEQSRTSLHFCGVVLAQPCTGKPHAHLLQLNEGSVSPGLPVPGELRGS